MCGSAPPTPAPTPAPKAPPVASDPNQQEASAAQTSGSTSADTAFFRKALNIDLSTGGQSGTGLSIPQ